MEQNAISSFIAPPPGGETTEYWPIITPRIDDMHFVSLGETYHGVYTHYINGRSVLCWKDVTGDCPTCPLVRRQWIGYLPVSDLITPQRKLLSLTPTAVRKSPPLNNRENVCGRHLKVFRQPRTKRGKVIVQWADVVAETIKDVSVADLKCENSSILRQLDSLFGLADGSMEKRARAAVASCSSP